MRRASKRQNGDNGTLWISFSDLMSALMLIFVLIMFYAVYQYYDMLEIKTAELTRQAGLLDERSSQLTVSQEELAQARQSLADKETELNTQSAKLTTAETALLTQQAKLLLQEQTLSELQTRLTEQENALAAAQLSLDESLAAQLLQQQQLTEQEAQLQAQQNQMEAQQAQLDKLVGVKSAIIEELVTALADSDISGASVDDSGAIVFSSEMMFDVNKSSLKEVGKNFLNSFIPSYFKVLMSDEYAQYVSQIIIEGHTDTQGSFLKNMDLSQERAYAVLRYILSDEFDGISETAKERLQQIVTVNGRSYSDPIYRPDGSVDMAASRRVVIKFRLNDEDMVNEMLRILDDMSN